MNIPDKQQINVELSRLIALQTAFYQKGNPTPDEIREFEQAGRRTQIPPGEWGSHKSVN